MDCSIMPTKFDGIDVISTTDFFYPLVDDPYVQGRIACANVLSDMYALAVVDCDNLLMLLSASTDMSQKERDVISKLMIRGFHDLALEAGTQVTGGQTVLNPWPIIGGVAMSMCKEEHYIRPVHAVVGDVIVLTKALGTQVAVNVHQWLRTKSEKWLPKVDGVVTEDEVDAMYRAATASMSRLNRTGARLMHKYDAHGCTDVTGFGILGHAQNLASNQEQEVDFIIHTLPVLRGSQRVDEAVGRMFKLISGFSAETSGGLLLCLPREAAADFCREIEEVDGCPAWIIGDVVVRKDDGSAGANSARIVDASELKVVDV
eukprot:TRINITY_DN7425_c0_g1_i1.p1 TRINITY_DN7425_c0_g1~~TRINITY_DN7425_c0_g1_i1.p1  ORF type:complete len:317 (-),score=65.19 TRINITY_DN7425_c0_g1_i1:638-1588(-)